MGRWIPVVALGAALAVTPSAAASAPPVSRHEAVEALTALAQEHIRDELSDGYRIDDCDRYRRARIRCRVREVDVPVYDNDTGLITLIDWTYRPIVFRDHDDDVAVRSHGFCGEGLSPCYPQAGPWRHGL